MTIKIYDTTLRDGAQSEDVSFSVEDMMRVAAKIAELGVHYIEGGWPGSNPRDEMFFQKMKGTKLGGAKLSAFGSTRRAGKAASEDANLLKLVASGTPVITIFGKTWDLHVREALKVSLEENLEMIADSISFLKANAEEVFYDAEHFFDGYKANPEYAVATLKAAKDAGADCLVLCDTNGGTLTWDLAAIIEDIKGKVDAPIGIHTHNDSEMAVANSLTAVRLGAVQVQGTVNGYGERCGNANLCSIIPALKLKMGMDSIPAENLKKLRDTSRFVTEIANLRHFKHQPYVGDSAFAHKGGIHVSAVMKASETYEHIKPELVGNFQRILVSDLSGRSNIIHKATEYGIDLTKDTPQVNHILRTLKEMESLGYNYEGAEGSFELLMKKVTGKYKSFFQLEGYRVIVEWYENRRETVSEATLRINVGDKFEYTAALGNGPVNALDNALRKAVVAYFPELAEIQLIDYKVRVLNAGEGTTAKVRVLIESGDGDGSKWGTVGVSENIIEASWEALVDSIEYRLLKEA
ncbi:MAG: citramalate synthase [Nitrospirae bacterium]|nr:citramalate synthase [Nitrospirota bacterium]